MGHFDSTYTARVWISSSRTANIDCDEYQSQEGACNTYDGDQSFRLPFLMSGESICCHGRAQILAGESLHNGWFPGHKLKQNYPKRVHIHHRGHISEPCIPEVKAPGLIQSHEHWN